MTDKPIFAPVPARAIGDERLTAEDVRVLCAIAVHDRFKANGVGCYASHTRLARMAGCHLKTLSRSLGRLAEAGYVVGRANPLNNRTRIYNVVYTDFDFEFLKAGGIATGSPRVTNPPETGNSSDTDPAPIGNRDFGKTLADQGDAGVNILGEASRDFGEPILIDPVETASRRSAPAKGLRKAGISVGALLGMIEREMKAGRISSSLREYLDDRVGPQGDLTADDPNYNRAVRLYEQLG